MAWKSYHTKSITDKNLLRFVTTEHLMQFLQTGSIWFARADQFHDKMESVLISDLKADPPDFEKIERRRKNVLVSCWHRASDRESLALWDTYADQQEKRRTAAIRFNRLELIRLIGDATPRNNLYYEYTLHHGAAVYKNMIDVPPDKLDEKRVLYPFFRKEGAFRYEKEYRFVIRSLKIIAEKGKAYHLGNAKQLPFHILLNPLLDRKAYHTLRNIIIDLGFADSIRESYLNKWLHPGQL